MSIVKYKLSNGRIAVYESTSYYDPEKKQARPRRKYLGLEDPDTGELIPSSGKRGPRRKDTATTPQGAAPASAVPQNAGELKKLRQELSRLSEENQSLRKQNGELLEKLSQYNDSVKSAIAVLRTVGR